MHENEDVGLRMKTATEYLALFNGIKQPEVEAQAKTVMRTLKDRKEIGLKTVPRITT
jgi:hypothetical protein